MKYVSIVLPVSALFIMTACQSVTTKIPASAKSAATSIAASASASWTSCTAYNALTKQGSTYWNADNMQYYCTDASNSSRHLRYRVFSDNTVARQEHGQAETVTNLDYDQDACFFNLLDLQANVTFDFYNITVNGSGRMTQFKEVPFGGTITTWNCTYVLDAAI